MKTYILQKNLPDIEAGAFVNFDELANCYVLTKQIGDNPYDNRYTFKKDVVENNPEWFSIKHKVHIRSLVPKGTDRNTFVFEFNIDTRTEHEAFSLMYPIFSAIQSVLDERCNDIKTEKLD